MSRDGGERRGPAEEADEEEHLRERADSSGSAMEVEGSVRKRVRQNTPSPQNSLSSIASSPPRLMSVDELMETAHSMTNMALAHEIVLNGEFQLQKKPPPEHSLEKHVSDIVRKAFWDCLQTQLDEDPPTYNHAIVLLGEIKESLLLLLLPGHTRLRSVIEEALDLQLIAQEAQNGALDFPRLATFILDTMGSLCAPARDDDIARLRTVSGVVPLFREIFQVLELMKMDMANFTIQSMRPHLQEQAIEYERKKFQEFLNKQPNALEFTTRWLTEAAQELRGVGSEKTAAAAVATTTAATTGERGATSAVPGQEAITTPAPPSAIDVLNHAYATLLSWDHGSRSFPETVLMDQARLEDMQLRLWGLELLAAVLLVTVGAGGTAVSGLSAFAGRLKSTAVALLEGKHIRSPGIGDTLVSVSEQMARELQSCLSEHGFPPLSSEAESFLIGQICSLNSEENAVIKLIESRVRAVMLGALVVNSPQRGPQPLPGGLSPIRAELEPLQATFARLMAFNRAVFAPVYTDVLRRVHHGVGSTATGPSSSKE